MIGSGCRNGEVKDDCGGAAQAVSFRSAMGMAFLKRLGGAMGLEA